MAESKMSDIIRASVEGIKSFTDVDTVTGNAIHTPSGVTVIPISKITVGFATGGLDYTARRRENKENFGGGGGTGVSITPIAFLTVGKNSEINLIPLTNMNNGVERVVSLIEHAPEIIEKIKDTLS